MTLPDQHPILLTDEEAITELLELVARHRRAGHLMALNLHVEEGGIASASIRYRPGAPPIELRLRVAEEADERDFRDTIPDEGQ